MQLHFSRPGGQMLSRKLTMIISITLVLLFLAYLGVLLMIRTGGPDMQVITEKKADPEAMTRGGLENEPPYPVMPGDVININSDDAAQLQRLPGIGPSLADSIISWREANGPFRSPSELRKVPGIGEEIFTALEDYIVTGDEQ